MTETVFIGVGSNIEPESNVKRAVEMILTQHMVVKASPFYWSEAVDRNGQKSAAPPFINGVLQLQTTLSPLQLKHNLLRPIESALGRIRTSDAFAPRPMDLDILLWGNRVEHTSDVTIPSPDIATRVFVALPLYEIAGNIAIPENGQTLQALVSQLDTKSLRVHPELSLTISQTISQAISQQLCGEGE